MNVEIKQQDLNKEFFTNEQCYITELSNSQDDSDVSIARARVEPGVITHWHRLINTTERYCVLEGTGLVEVGDKAPQQISVGDVVIIPPLCRQRITNNGDSDLVFLAICSPRFLAENYEGLE